MKRLLTILFLLITLTVRGTVYYIAPSTATPAGSNSNSGTITSPWLTLNYAWSHSGHGVVGGDIIYMRGGTYTYAMMGQTTLSGIDGSIGNYIYVWNYPGENPVIDFSDYPNTSGGNIIRIENADYVYLNGIHCTNMSQPESGAFTHVGIRVTKGVNHSIIERCEVDHIGGWGFTIMGGSDVSGEQCSNNLILNCDSHHNSDPYSGDPYGGADGFLSNCYAGTTYLSMNNTFRGCRAWWNSDDGWDLRTQDGSVIIDNCWSFWNGYIPGTFTHAGNGEGFKLGTKLASPNTADVRRTVTNCLAFENYLLGFHHFQTVGYYAFSSIVYNNTAYNNGDGGNFNFGTMTIAQDILRNNLSYLERNYISNQTDDQYNSWNTPPGVTVTSPDFVSLSTTGVDGVRQEDGSLPVLNFLKLQNSSDLVDAGINVGLPYNGSAPDLGAFETGTKSPTVPLLTTTTITNITSTTATSGGNVYDDGGETVTDRGICWSTSSNPVITDSHTHNGTGTGSYISYLISLTDGFTYYVRAYATNSVGTGYGNQRSFVAGTPPPPPEGTLVSNESGTQFVKIGNVLIKIE